MSEDTSVPGEPVSVSPESSLAVVADDRTLADLEKVIATGLVEAGRALAQIRDSGLYKAEYKTFEAYCQERWGFTGMRARQLEAGAAVVENVNNCLQGKVTAPTHESHTRELAKLPPDQQGEVWEEAVTTAPKGKVTAEHVKAVVAKRLPTDAAVNPPAGPDTAGTPAPAEPPDRDTPEAKDVTATIIRRVVEVLGTFREAFEMAVRLDALRDELAVCPGKRGRDGRQLKAEIRMIEEAFEARLAELTK